MLHDAVMGMRPVKPPATGMKGRPLPGRRTPPAVIPAMSRMQTRVLPRTLGSQRVSSRFSNAVDGYFSFASWLPQLPSQWQHTFLLITMKWRISRIMYVHRRTLVNIALSISCVHYLSHSSTTLLMISLISRTLTSTGFRRSCRACLSSPQRS
jgi:hypothetical protein